MLIILGGLPGVGKTTIAREVARRLGAVHLRIDSIEQAIRDAGVATSVDDAGYRVAYAVAEENLRLGRTVVADSVNPWPITRDAWADVAKRAACPAIEIELICSDPEEHRRRVERRRPDIPGFVLPTWQEVVEHDYRPWHRDRLVVDTAGATPDRGVEQLLDAVRNAVG